MPRSHRSKPPRLLLPFLTLALISLVVLTWFLLASRPVDSSDTKRINFTIDRGQGLDSIALELKELGLIRSTAAFKVQIVLSNLSGKIQAGDFSIPKSFSLSEVAQSLTQGTYDRWVTILEGWRREEIAQELVNVLEPENKEYAFDPDAFLNLTKNLEGELFPDTYSLPKTSSASAIINRLHSQFTEKISTLTNNSGFTDKEAIIIASLVEREAVTNAERPIIAGILIKRLNQSWPLQVDAATQYFKATQNCRLLTCDWWKNDLTKEDRQTNSPYNTYLNPGLPPTPISNPSFESLKAAFNPVATDYWFYIHDRDGKVHFAETIEEHNQNIAKYLQ